MNVILFYQYVRNSKINSTSIINIKALDWGSNFVFRGEIYNLTMENTKMINCVIILGN